MSKNVLVVTTVPADDTRLRDAIGDAGEVRIVAPAAKVGKLDWLTNAEDDARGEATQAADQTADALRGNVTIDRTSHDTNAADSIEDALRNFDADEIVVVTDRDSTWLEDETARAAMDSTGLPVRQIELS